MGKFISCPVLVLHAGRGKLGPDDVSQEWIDAFCATHVVYAIVREAGHWLRLEQPEWFLAHLEPILARTSTWRTFLANHTQSIWAADLLTVHTIAFKTLYVLLFVTTAAVNWCTST